MSKEIENSGLSIMAGSKSKRAITFTNKKGVHYRTPLAVWTGLEPATPCVTGMYSNQLNYHTIFYVLLSFPDCECKGSTFFYTYKSFCCFLIKKSSFWGMSFKNRLVLMVILSYKLPRKRICPIL